MFTSRAVSANIVFYQAGVVFRGLRSSSYVFNKWVGVRRAGSATGPVGEKSAIRKLRSFGMVGRAKAGLRPG